MRIKVFDSAQLRSLVQFLTFDQNVLLTTISDTEIEVGFVGSLNTWAHSERQSSGCAPGWSHTLTRSTSDGTR